MINIDGSSGEGGGQILRTSLALAMLTGQSFRVCKIRAGRDKPGLMRQHLTALNAATTICNATVDGAAIGAQEITFAPGKVRAGNYTFSIGSAGSTTLVLQTVLPALLTADAPSSLTLEGGTHNPYAPPLDFLELAFGPLINRMGPKLNLTMERAGFYPAGGGRVLAHISPVAKLQPLHLLERGEIKKRLAKATISALSGEIAKRELARVEKLMGWTEDQLQILQLPSEWGPGNLLTLEIQSEHLTEVFTGFGMKGLSAEGVAEDPIRQARQYLKAGVPVGQYLADQLLLPLAMAGGGSFITMQPSKHTITNADVIAQFLSLRLQMKEIANGNWLVEVA